MPVLAHSELVAEVLVAGSSGVYYLHAVEEFVMVMCDHDRVRLELDDFGLLGWGRGEDEQKLLQACGKRDFTFGE